MPVSDAEVRGLLTDCLTLWGVAGRVAVEDDGIALTTPAGRYVLRRAAPDLRPVRWLLETPGRMAAGRGPRAAASIVAVLSVLRNETATGTMPPALPS